MLDYVSAVTLVILPWILGFNDVLTATWILLTVGFMIFMMSLFTNYEGGMMAAVPIKIHLIIDIFTGLAVAFSPCIFEVSDRVNLPISCYP